MKRIDEVAVSLPHEYYPAIGEFMFKYAQLEYLLHELLWRCIDVDNKQGRTLTIGADISAIFATLFTVTSTNRWISTPRFKGEIGNVVKVAREYKNLRNQLAHGSWQFPKNGKPADVWMHYIKETPDQRLLPSARKLEPSLMHKASGKLGATLGRAKRLILEIEQARPARVPSPAA
jgi:hypothetical protein